MAVGADATDVGGSTNQGCVHVYELDAQNTWVHRQQITASDGEPNDRFGYSLVWTTTKGYWSVLITTSTRTVETIPARRTTTFGNGSVPIAVDRAAKDCFRQCFN